MELVYGVSKARFDQYNQAIQSRRLSMYNIILFEVNGARKDGHFRCRVHHHLKLLIVSKLNILNPVEEGNILNPVEQWTRDEVIVLDQCTGSTPTPPHSTNAEGYPIQLVEALDFRQPTTFKLFFSSADSNLLVEEIRDLLKTTEVAQVPDIRDPSVSPDPDARNTSGSDDTTGSGHEEGVPQL